MMNRSPILRIAGGVLLALFLFVGWGFGIIFPPTPKDPVVRIERGMNTEEIAHLLKESGVIRSRIFFVWAAYFSGNQNRLGAGSFEFTGSQSTFTVFSTLLAQRERTVLITEGSTIKDIARVLSSSNMAAGTRFEEVAESMHPGDGAPLGAPMEGFLFPDTYRFHESSPAEEIVKIMHDEFFEKIEPLRADITSTGRTLYDIITVASIIEREVQTPRDMRIVSDILWKRLAQDIPLQVDASLFYVTGKASHELETEDLESESPYNTYEYKGLPPTPISNPGLEAIRAALYPEPSPYLFYLSGKDGTTHFASTFDEHKKNKALYLK